MYLRSSYQVPPQSALSSKRSPEPAAESGTEVSKTQTTQKQENKYEVKPQYEELSKQLIIQHAIINAMKCMRDIKERIARPVYQLAIISISLYTRTVYQPGKSSVRDLHSPSAHHSSVISPGTANLKPSLTGHDNSARKTLTQKLTLTEECSGNISQKALNEQALRVSSNPRFRSPNWYQSVEKLKRSSAPPISFKTTAGHGGNRRKRITVNSSYRGFRRMEIRNIG
ncbi:hypothetical protein F511_20886 [Dorcoceras hygrometricum]|uniref:Uncharacterized protein n=1 Tax=Dorcoceras hygrometricum TaxID=472368 RepID=A0A2Z7D8R7_9LAMI|nr:hypothetical protein F511_20886 [Dorcoceras hygrometricum]